MISESSFLSFPRSFCPSFSLFLFLSNEKNFQKTSRPFFFLGRAHTPFFFSVLRNERAYNSWAPFRLHDFVFLFLLLRAPKRRRSLDDDVAAAAFVTERNTTAADDDDEGRGGGKNGSKNDTNEAKASERGGRRGGRILMATRDESSEYFETHVVTKLNGNDVKFFYDVNSESRAVIKRSGVNLADVFKIGDFDTTSTISWALEKCSEKKERFCAWKMALNGNLELLEFLRGKGCPWDEKDLF